ncbi:SGNH/GDSL hydrolase family protein [Brevundimonas sp.]|uniref:SGNH/GDSL hydrolase family protein n=1 Tax=Brevundimonas sp. TaxID=1871086 RepID=UPI0025C51159|nr:SGNH/GDSL hydrolase family protein [Brevundimonas sp.]
MAFTGADVVNVKAPGDKALALADGLKDLPFHRWAKRFSGLQALPPVMASPPTMNMSAVGGASTIPTPNTISKDSLLISRSGTWTQYSGDTAFNAPERAGAHISFKLTGRRFDIRGARVSGSTRGFSILVDGELVTKTPWDQFLPGLTNKASSATARHRFLCDFGANLVSFRCGRANIGTPSGSGYVVGDVLTLTGGTFTSPAQVRVGAVNGSGAIISLAVTDSGAYSVVPNNTVAVTGGSGTGAVLLVYWNRVNTTKKTRRIDIIADYGTMLGEINVDADASVTPAELTGAKLLFAGDSITEYQLADYAGGIWAQQVAWKLGAWDRSVPFGTSGRGWLATTPFSLDVAAIIAEAPDMLVIALGTNDASNEVNLASLTAEVTARLAELLEALPYLRIVVVGPFVDATGTYTSAIAAGVAAVASADQARVRFVDFHALGIYAAGSDFSASYGTASDVHPSQDGHDVIANGLALPVAQAFLSMAA